MSSPFRRVPLVLGALAAFACKDPKPTTGALVVEVSGLPAGASADVRVLGPNDFNEPVSQTRTFEQLEPGEYDVRRNTVTHANALYSTAQTQERHTLVAGQTAVSNAAYALTGGSIDLDITGLPVGMGPSVMLFGPNNFSRIVLTSGIQAGLSAGAYTIRADTFTAVNGDRYGANAFSQAVTVTASTTPATAAISYAVVSGTLDVTVQGLSTGANPPPVTITGPGVQRTTATSVSLRGLVAGTYTISAVRTGTCPSILAPDQETQTIQLAASASEARTVTYSPQDTSAGSLNFKIDGAYLVQVAQDFAGNVPMIAGRKALARVFGTANQCNSVKPKVRITVSNGQVFDNLVLGAGETATQVLVNEGVLSQSWNVEIPASAVQGSTLGFFAEIDSDNAFAETNESDNRFPASGNRSVAVRTMGPTGFRFVPVHQSVNDSTGRVNDSNKDAFLNLSRRIHPVFEYDVSVRATYTTGQQVLQANNQNGAWAQLLNEIAGLRAQDTSNRYYYGVVRVGYTSGVAGVAFVGGKTGLGWDFLPSASAVLAHELGHNFGSIHTPCGNPGGVDPAYPSTGFYVGGFTGTYGYDFTDGTVKSPQFFSDIMGYCNNQWISDYSYVKMLSHLTNPNAGPTLPMVAASVPVQPSILVWGRIVNGVPVLEPAFEVVARPELPAFGSNRLTGTDASGRELFSVSFEANQIADLPGDHESFAFTIPRSMLRGRDLASLRFTTRFGRTATSTPSVDVASDAGMTLSRAGLRGMRLRWNAARFPVVMVRDPVSGDVISFARGGDVTIVTDRDELEMNYSNRVRSIRELRRLR